MTTDLFICHAQNPTWRGDDPPKFPEDFQTVAVVSIELGEGEDTLSDMALLDYAFQQTNHIDRSWWENKDVTCLRESRSTSVGDVVVLSSDRAFRCESSGWSPVESAPESVA